MMHALHRACCTLLLATCAIVCTPRLLAQTLTIVGGDNQRAPRRGSEVPGGIAHFLPLVVQLRDAGSNPMVNAQVTFHCSVPRTMACQFTPGGAENGTLHVNSGSDGVALLNQIGGESMHVYYSDGPVGMTASWQNQTVSFHLAVDPKSGPEYLYFAKVVSGDKQTAVRTGQEP